MTHEKDEEWSTHPAAVQVSFSRFTGSIPGLYGSPLRSHEGGVALRITRSSWKYEDGLFRTHTLNPPLMEVWLSPLQFAELLTTMNRDPGVPGTLRVLNEGLVEKWSTDPKGADVLKVHEEFVRRSAEFVTQMRERSDRIRALMDEKKVPKGVSTAINSLLESMMVELASNRPYAVELFQEALQKLMVQMKANLAAEGYSKALPAHEEVDPLKLEEGQHETP